MRLLPPLAIAFALILALAPTAAAQTPMFTNLQGTHLCVEADGPPALGRSIDFSMSCSGFNANAQYLLALAPSAGLSVVQLGGSPFPVALDNAFVIAQGTVAASGRWGTTITVPPAAELLGMEFQAQLLVAEGANFSLSALFSIGPIIQDVIH